MFYKMINIGYQDEAIVRLEEFKKKNYGNLDIKISNLHLTRLNVLTGKSIFTKKDGYIAAETLFDIMRGDSGRDKHHFHNLSSNDVYKSLKFLSDPICVIGKGDNRFITISSFLSSLNIPILVVIEINAGLTTNKEARINKIVTIFPSSRTESYVKKATESGTILYKK